MPPDLTFKQLQWDLETLEKAEAAFEIESAKEYDFTPTPREESTNQEPELAEQTA
jgi:hypothetical protein